MLGDHCEEPAEPENRMRETIAPLRRSSPTDHVFSTLLGIFLSSVLVATPAAPQEDDEQATSASSRKEILRKKREQKAAELTPEKVSSHEARLIGWEKANFPSNWLVKGWNGFRPVFGGMPSGSGTVFGAGYVHGLENQYYQFQVNGRYSTKSFTQFDTELVIPPPQVGRRIEGKFRAAYRDYLSLSFFGLGNDSSVDNQSSYLYNATNATGDFWLNPRGLLSLGATAGYLTAKATAGKDEPTLPEIFPPATVPGATGERTDFIITGGWAEFDLSDKWHDPPVGVVARITGHRYEDTSFDTFDFSRVILDVKGYVPLFKRNRTLALRFRTSHSIDDDEATVPFYLMETLGGAKTIRGYDEYRFRDTRNLYVSAEYRWEIFAYLDATFFFDAGKVFDDLEDFNFKQMHTGYGFGFRAHMPGGMKLVVDFAHSSEGFKLHISSGPAF